MRRPPWPGPGGGGSRCRTAGRADPERRGGGGRCGQRGDGGQLVAEMVGHEESRVAEVLHPAGQTRPIPRRCRQGSVPAGRRNGTGARSRWGHVGTRCAGPTGPPPARRRRWRVRPGPAEGRLPSIGRPGPVEVMGRYSNHVDQEERVSALLDPVPATPRRPEISTTKQVHRRLRPDLVDDLVAGYEGGRTVRQLADQFGIGRETVSKLLRRRGVRTRHQSLTASQTQIAVNLYRSGMSLVQVADRMARSRTAIYNALRRDGCSSDNDGVGGIDYLRSPEAGRFIKGSAKCVRNPAYGNSLSVDWPRLSTSGPLSLVGTRASRRRRLRMPRPPCSWRAFIRTLG